MQGDVFRAIKAHLQRDAMKVFSSLVSAHRSRNEPSNVQDGDCRDGEKLLCNNRVLHNFPNITFQTLKDKSIFALIERSLFGFKRARL